MPISPKKRLYLTLPDRCDIAVQLARKRLSTALKRAYNAANLILLYETQRLPIPRIRSYDSVLSTSLCIQKFTCSCGQYYFGRTDLMLGIRAKEHLPKWLLSACDRNELTDTQTRDRAPALSIARHIISVGHNVDFSSITVSTRGHRSSILGLIEAILIDHQCPKLCVRKCTFISLNLNCFHFEFHSFPECTV